MFKYSSLSFFILLFSFQSINAQDADKTVSITVSGSGKTQDEAKQSALRSAIEQAFGAFISSKTEILNDQVVADQMASVSSGNIQSFKVLNDEKLSNGDFFVTIKASVSIGKLANYVKSIGGTVDINGGLFSLNAKIQEINKSSEFIAVRNIIGAIHNQMQESFDFNLKIEEPKSSQFNSINYWEIPLTINSKPNENYLNSFKYFINSLNSISCDQPEFEKLQSQNLYIGEVYIINSKGEKGSVYFRNPKSIMLINQFITFLNFYQTNFTLIAEYQNGSTEIPIEKMKLNNSLIQGWQPTLSTDTPSNFVIFDKNNVDDKYFIHDFKFGYKIQLSDLEKLKNITVKSSGKIFEYKLDGFQIPNSKIILSIPIIDIGTIASENTPLTSTGNELKDLENFISKIKNPNVPIQESFIWQLPTVNEWIKINRNFYLLGIDLRKSLYNMDSDFLTSNFFKNKQLLAKYYNYNQEEDWNSILNTSGENLFSKGAVRSLNTYVNSIIWCPFLKIIK